MGIWGSVITKAERDERNRVLRSERIARARKIGTHTKKEWLEMLEASGSTCARCGEFGPCEKDHVLPIYQGGSDSIRNLQPMCRSCNSSKGSESIDHREGKPWMRPEWERDGD